MMARQYKVFLVAYILVSASSVSNSEETIDEDLHDLIANVSEAAHDHNYESLARLMVEEFLYSFGGSRQRDEAIQWYKDHPELLLTLETVLSQPCAFTDAYGLKRYICPAAAADLDNPYYEHRAAFRRDESGDWSFVGFVAGD